MIVVVEGPSAAGKTTWITRHCNPQFVVPEIATTQSARAPDPSDSVEAAGFWAALNVERWQRAVRLEASRGIAVCDTDPFKLHYTWTLWRAGHATRVQWVSALEAHRSAFGAGHLGLADLILVNVPPVGTLTRRRDQDHTRGRRNFAVHLDLADPLVKWYRAMERLEPDRVVWGFPSGGLPAGVARDSNTGTARFDALVELLPAR